MSKITNDDLTPSGTGYFSCIRYGHSGRQRVKSLLSLLSLYLLKHMTR